MAAAPATIPGALEWLFCHYRWPNETLYHYTSFPAAQSILEKRQMWASDLRSMNDPHELRYGKRLMEDRFRKASKQARNRARKLWLESVYSQLVTLVANRSSSYSISLSAHPNLAHQWCDYAARGTGVALGWSIDSDYPGRPLKTWVIYDRRRQEEIVDGMIVRHLTYIDQQPSLDTATTSGLSLLRFLDVFLQTFKSQKWAPEDEFRFVYQFFDDYIPDNQEFKTRTVDGVEKKYIEADFSTVALRHVVIGPVANVTSTTEKLRSLFMLGSYGEVPISASSLDPNVCRG